MNDGVLSENFRLNLEELIEYLHWISNHFHILSLFDDFLSFPFNTGETMWQTVPIVNMVYTSCLMNFQAT